MNETFVDNSYSMHNAYEKVDGTFLHAVNLVTMTMVKRDFKDAIGEMDGDRLYRIWKLKMLFFREGGRFKYANEALRFQADQISLLSPADAHRQRWNRAFSTRGGKGNNIDLMLEHQNNYLN